MERRNIQVPRGHAGEAVARILHDGLGVPHATAKGLIDAGCVKVNGRPARTHGQRCAGGDIVEVMFDPVRQYRPVPEPRHGRGFRVVYEDKEIVVVDKEPGVLSSPAPGMDESLAERIAESLRSRGIKRPQLFVIHRLDRHTSGLLVFAKSQRALESIAAQFESREAGRIYLAIVAGPLAQERGTITSWLVEDPRSLSVRTTALRGAGKRAITHFEVAERFEAATLVRVRLETGRKHQIRVHFAEIGHPVLGDRRYGSGSPLIQRVALHAERLTFVHPRTREVAAYESPWPEDLEHLARTLRKREAAGGAAAQAAPGVVPEGRVRASRVVLLPNGLTLTDVAPPIQPRVQPRAEPQTGPRTARQESSIRSRPDRGARSEGLVGGKTSSWPRGRPVPSATPIHRPASGGSGSDDASRSRAAEGMARAPVRAGEVSRLARERAVGFKPRPEKWSPAKRDATRQPIPSDVSGDRGGSARAAAGGGAGQGRASAGQRDATVAQRGAGLGAGVQGGAVQRDAWKTRGGFAEKPGKPSGGYAEKPRGSYAEKPRGSYAGKASGGYAGKPRGTGAGDRSGSVGSGVGATAGQRGPGQGGVATGLDSQRAAGQGGAVQRDAWKPRGGFAEKPRGSYAGKPGGGHAGKPRGSYAGKASGGYAEKPRGSYAGKPSGGDAEKPRGSYAGKPSGGYAEKPRGSYAGKPSSGHAGKPRGSYAEKPNGGHAEKPRGTGAGDRSGSVSAGVRATARQGSRGQGAATAGQHSAGERDGARARAGVAVPPAGSHKGGSKASAGSARKPWEFRQKGSTLRRAKRQKIAAARARRKKDR